MSDDQSIEPPFDGDSGAERELWSALAELPRAQSPERLRRNFHRGLERHRPERFAMRLRGLLGFRGNAGWVTAAACLLAGVAVGKLWLAPGDIGPGRLAALERNVALLNRELILDRLQDRAAGKRLRAAVDAQSVAGNDAQIARALLLRATGDRVQSVRTAAIDALGPSLSDTVVGDELMKLLERAESPLVQLALVDLILRHGSAAQLDTLSQVAAAGALHPDLVRHVEKALGRETV